VVNGETETGVTTMFIEPTLDTGPILLQRKTPIGEKETAPELMERLARIGAELLGETLARLDNLTPRPQHDRDATYAPVLNKEDGLIDWSLSAFDIERRIRGFQPWPNAYTSFNSKSLILWEAQPSISVTSGIANGEVIVAHGDELVVQCGEQTALRVLEVQPEARKKMAARDFINGMRLKVGDRFG
jgi:methionyl-tRNA formyltransferase